MLFVFCPNLPFLDVALATGDLQVVNLWTDVCQLVKDGQHYELDESSLSSGNICGGSVTHHGDLKSLSFLHVTLVKELFK